jgi:hypothetical protein
VTFEEGADRLSRNVGNYMLRDAPEERSSHLLRGGRLKSQELSNFDFNWTATKFDNHLLSKPFMYQLMHNRVALKEY